MTKNMKRIHKVVVKRLFDDDPDTSYLEQPEFEQRLADWHRERFYYLGIRAHAEICIPSEGQNADTGILQQITSGGLWGIESDSDTAYLKEIEQEQLSELRDQLHAIGFSQRAISAAFKDVQHCEQ